MYQTLLWRKQILKITQGLSLSQLEYRFLKFLSRKQWRQLSKFIMLIVPMVIMLLWNWRLLLATLVGASLMLGIYLLQGWNWQAYIADWERFWYSSHRKLAVAVVSGGVAALSTYMAATIWLDTENRWLATGAILQGLGTLLTLLLLLWHLFTHHNQRQEAVFDQLVQDLAHIEPLKRLIAVRQLARLAENARLSSDDRHQLAEYFRLLLSQETEPMIRDAVLESWQSWGQVKILNKLKVKSLH